MKQCKRWLSITLAAVSVFNVLLYYAVHAMWSGIIAILGEYSPYVVMAAIIAVAIYSVIACLTDKRWLIPSIIAIVLSAFFLGVELYILSVTADSYKYFVREFFSGLFWFAVIAAFVFIVFYFPRTRLYANKWLKGGLVAVLVLALFFSCFQILPNSFTSTPIVYAVEDDYQIVFTTRDKGTAWVVIDGIEYNDTYAGYRRSEDTVHKITVPQSALDKASGYTIYSRAMFLRGPYSAFQGRTIEKSYNWRGVNTSDGINYYVVSDTHTDFKAPAKAAAYFGDKLDFLICGGDTANWIDTQDDIMYFLKLAGTVTKGEIPVVYARGNHETKGLLADELYKYVGSVNQNFYFTFRLKNIWGVVLDEGEDHGDDWSEFYGAPRFDAYREEQIAFLDEVIENKESEYAAEDVEYRIAVCHMPVTFEYRSDNAKEFKDAWIDRLNQMDISIMYSGHRHQLMYVPAEWEDGTELVYYKAYAGYDGSRPDGYATHANFPSILVSRKSNVQEITTEGKDNDTLFIGVAASVVGNTTVLKFTDQDGKALDNILSPWFEGVSYGSQIVVENK